MKKEYSYYLKFTDDALELAEKQLPYFLDSEI